MIKGIIFDIKELAVHDGDGVRITVFLKGCPLKCIWCHNPEGQDFHPQIIKSKSDCMHCGLCERGCSHPQCVPFKFCTRICPKNLIRISGIEYTPKELSEKIKGYKMFFKGGGGVTFSGGEPLARHEFLNEVLDNLNGISTAIETSVYTDEEVFQKTIKRFDIVIIDIKHMDPILHKKYTGVSNKLILNNISSLKRQEKAFIVRIPLIPSINDTDENLIATADFLKDFKNVTVELLPYNKLTGAKYSLISQQYNPPFDETKMPNTNITVFKDRQIKVKII